MFQNYAEVEDAEKVSEKSNQILYRLKEIFKYQNVVIYILTFLLSMLSIKGELMPFGLAMIAACIGENIPIIGVFVASIIGVAIGGNISDIGNFLAISAVYFCLVLFFKSKIAVEDRNEEVKAGGKLFAACVIVSIVKSFIGIFLMYDVFMGVIYASIVYIFYKIFVNGLASIKNFNEKKAFTIEELIATVIIIALASTVFNKINIFSLNISNIIIIFMIMVLGWKNGMVIGAISGISIGLAISFIDGTSFVQISMFAISGILSGLLNKFGKIGVIIGFLLGNAILTYWVRGASTVVIYFREIFIASIGLLLVPNKFKITVEDLIGKDKLLDNGGDKRLNGQEEVSNKLKTISQMFNDFMNIKEQNEFESKEELVQDFLDNLEEINKNIFFEEISNEDNGIAKDICKIAIQKDVLVDNDLIEILKQHNNYVVMQDENIKNDLQEIVKIANRTIKIYQINKAKEQERENTIKSMNENLKGAVKVIDECADEMLEKKENKFSKKEQELMVLFKSKNLKVEDCHVKKLKNGKYIIELKLDYNDNRVREKDIITNIADLISKNIGTRILLQRERNNEEKNEYYQVYSSEDKFVLQVGNAKVTKDNNKVSGDCSLQIKLADGKYLLAISDGMGSGEQAREYSKLTLRLIKQMLIAGFDNEESVKMINSRINYLGSSKRYSTLDASILDLYTGKLELLKMAACNTYIKNKKSIRKIKSELLPVGILDEVEVKSQNIDIFDGDIIVMCSDGIIESKNEEWLESFLKNVTTNNVQKIADLILAESIDNNYGIAQDDMTVIVSKVVKKK